MTVALVPSSGREVGAERGDATRFDVRTEVRETRHGVAHVVA